LPQSVVNSKIISLEFSCIEYTEAIVTTITIRRKGVGNKNGGYDFFLDWIICIHALI
jgi:hypothetical protein